MAKEDYQEDDRQQLIENDELGLLPSHIVGVGASAGGLEAIESFFKEMPADSGVAFVVIQHLSPDHKSLMAELLSKRTRMPVHRAEEGMLVEKDSVYLIPPNRNLTLFHGRLMLSDQDRDSRGINLPIDIFLRSLAEDQGAKAIAIILSGTGSDGSSGLRAIKEELGMVMAQTEESAAFDGMPRSAIATGLVDFILSPDDMPKQLLSYLKHPYTSKNESTDSLLSDEDGLTRIFALLRDRNGIDFTYYKPSTIVRRIERRMAVNQLHDLNDYVRYLESYSAELNALHRDLLIGVTSFFRDSEAYDLLNLEYLSVLFGNAKGNKLRVWIAGCSTGEEAYSIAILCHEVRQRMDIELDIKIFATDVDREAIMKASAGVFAESAVAQIDPELLSRYFYRKDEGFHISRQIREMVVFAQHNLVKDPPFTNIDFISCRNLLIYLQPVLQRRVLELFNFSLNSQGLMFLGSSETTGEMAEYFDPLDQKWRIYRSKGRRRLSELSETASSYHPARRFIAGRVGSRINQPLHEEERMLERLIEGASEDYLPFSMVINESFELMQVVGDSKDYLQVPTGKVVNDVSKLAKKDLAMPLATGLQKVFKTMQEIRYTNIHIRDADETVTVNMRIKPLPQKKGQRVLVGVFIEHAQADSASRPTLPESYDIGREAEQRIIDLENELQFVRENLQATVEELETSNEELQATNEELLASNEELQSTNEELQSVNEELYTVNAEYQGKITELTEVNNDLDNLLSNTRVATLFVDENLDIRRFTSEVTKLFRVLDQDIGRPLGHIAHDMIDVDLLTLAKKVQATSNPVEMDVMDKHDERYLMRLFPYQIAPDNYAGIVLTFVNVTRIREIQQALNERRLRMKTILSGISDGYLLADSDDRIKEVNDAALSIFGYQREDLINEPLNKLIPGDAISQASNQNNGGALLSCFTQDVGKLELTGSVYPMHVNGKVWNIYLLKT